MEDKVLVNFIEAVGFSQNPANGLAAARRWRLSLLKTIKWALEEGAFEGLLEWALVERANYGSFWRAKWPDQITPSNRYLEGSARWHARDEGGHYRLLRDCLAEAVDMAIHDKRHPVVAANTLVAILGWPMRWNISAYEICAQLIGLVVTLMEKELQASAAEAEAKAEAA